MPTVRAEIQVTGTVSDAESLWYDTSRWQTFIDQLAHVDRTEDPWPEAGGKVIWDSNPAGRGRVVERAIAYEPRAGQTVEVEDESIVGTQYVSFTPAGNDEVLVALTLEYRIKKRSPLTPLLDVLFVRRPMTASLQSTLYHFAIELGSAREESSR